MVFAGNLLFKDGQIASSLVPVLPNPTRFTTVTKQTPYTRKTALQDLQMYLQLVSETHF